MVAPDGERLGPYRLLSRLGAGGFGEVHLGLDPEGRTVAVKILHPHVAADETALTRLAREVETMRRVRGRHVAEVLDASLAGERPYLVTRYVQGRALSTVVAAGGPLPGGGLVRVARGLAEALVAIHAAGVVHRDLKPANVILTDGEPVVIDFGIACALDSPSVTASGAVLGTPGYLAPEVLEDTGSGPASDVFSFGATVAFAATGRHPYGTGPASAVGYRVVHHAPDLDGVPEGLEPLLRECLLRDPAERPDAAALLARLDGITPDGITPDGATPDARPGYGRAGPVLRVALPEAGRASVESWASGPAAAGEPAGSHPPGPAAVHDPAGARGPGPAVREPAGSYSPVREPAGSYPPVPATPVGEPIPPADGGGVHGLTTQQWRPGRRPPRGKPSSQEAFEHRRAVLHRRWVVGTGLLVSLMAATARNPLPELSLLLLTAYGSAMLVDGGVALFARRDRRRMIIDLSAAAGTVALWAVLGTFFSTLTLALALGTVLFVIVAILVGS
ncbi:putative Ser/Thr protein kinase [Streptosporangium becharense]|uniref:Putative Ser/Thr protein kinase n=1 Tax=Streptosporangium becharense TaxID=1816182 RepID=A0A7W9IJG9_9ACTN|nr:serine/threonine-protein kinase [Streptosporangium becharense]MBB2913917.1 putative Ser/Thr protein kinase [Streptosporangium becharense]MBB5821421.1 putative Ser/Thr protein kinase [Streptosporangium becharense]